jgi:hypothetical protein
MINNKSVIKLEENPKFYKRSKHINIAYYFIRENIQQNKIQILYILTKKQLANLLIKSLNITTFKKLKDLRNILNIENNNIT